MESIEARVVDARHLELASAIALPSGSLVRVIVGIADGKGGLQDDWRRYGMERLSQAYGNDEPDYPVSCVREPNPGYQP
jgi:hypothetical protein